MDLWAFRSQLSHQRPNGYMHRLRATERAAKTSPHSLDDADADRDEKSQERR